VRASLQKLPEQYRQVLRAEALAAAVWERGMMTQRNAAALTEMQQKYRVQVSSVNPGELRAEANQIQDEVAQRLGFTDLLSRVRAAAH
jgi:TRAP-type C4-dicarboxylate transport system substrate-binding protein